MKLKVKTLVYALTAFRWSEQLLDKRRRIGIQIIPHCASRHVVVYTRALIAFLIVFSVVADAEYRSTDVVEKIQRFLALPEDEIDLARTRFLIEAALYDDMDVAASERNISNIVATIKTMPEYGPSSLEKLGTAIRYLYTAGPWNHQQAYRYDLDDPMGTLKPRGKSVVNYMATKKGNCVSMPILLLLLSERLGVGVNLVLAPHHMFVRYTDADKKSTNIETTSGTLLSDARYVEEFGIRPEAIEQGVYLRSLTKKEAVALMLYDLGQAYLDSGQYDIAHKTVDLMLGYHPKFVNAVLLKGNLYARMLHSELATMKAAGLPRSQAERRRLDSLQRQNLAWFSKAEALGWREPAAGLSERYMHTVERFKAHRGN
ncbi:hypothetical protein FKG94_02235 [Exilibacterium tricleocarpae]|uniref:Protein SirB1 N-terminal domain-containing protein n=1 Tax=Exilibacterium tricleocarpae TaxID=2591008 RepID=A0A545U8F3_9GAMM|nr:transglutaminase family protein [Exilibacterium tricleocarpae]TQV85683.1 hypothetical protein FKG94_02235 [Exilibacterium tricleocarpae]